MMIMRMRMMRMMMMMTMMMMMMMMHTPAWKEYLHQWVTLQTVFGID